MIIPQKSLFGGVFSICLSPGRNFFASPILLPFRSATLHSIPAKWAIVLYIASLLLCTKCIVPPTALEVNLLDNESANFLVQQGSNDYIKINTTNDSELITIGNINTDPDVVFNTGGNVGIGTTSPVGKLHIASSDSSYDFMIDPVAINNATCDDAHRGAFKVVTMGIDDVVQVCLLQNEFQYNWVSLN